MIAAPQASAQEQEQITGTVTGIITKGPDKWQVAVTTDDNRTRNLWTKDQALVGQLAQMVGQRLGFLCNISTWMRGTEQVRSLWIEAAGQAGIPAAAPPLQQVVPNSAAMPQAQPLNTGLPVQTGSPMPAAQPQHVVVHPQVVPIQAAPQPTMAQDQREVLRQGMIHRQTATKVAAILLSSMPAEERTFSNLVSISERLVAYYDHGAPAVAQPQTVEDLVRQAMPASMEGAVQQQGDTAYDSAAAQGQGYENTPPDDDIPF